MQEVFRFCHDDAKSQNSRKVKEAVENLYTVQLIFFSQNANPQTPVDGFDGFANNYRF